MKSLIRLVLLGLVLLVVALVSALTAMASATMAARPFGSALRRQQRDRHRPLLHTPKEELGAVVIYLVESSNYGRVLWIIHQVF